MSKPYNRQAEQDNVIEYVFGKVQPQAVPLEEAVLGAVMLDREALTIVMDILKPESFYKEAHQHIYRACLKLYNESNPVDLLTVTEALRKAGKLEDVGGGYYLVELSNRVASAANIEYHARIVAQKYLAREMIRVCSETLKTAFEDIEDPFDLLGKTEHALFRISMGVESNETKNAGDIAVEVLRGVEAACNAKQSGSVGGVTSGLKAIDEKTGGFQNSDLIIIAGRPSMGKSSLSANTIAFSAAKSGIPTVIYSLEMSAPQLIARILSGESKVSSRNMMTGEMADRDWQELQGAIQKMDGLPLYVDDTAAISGQALRAKARRMKTKYNIGLVIIDYLQLMSGEGFNEEQRVGTNARTLKLIAKELNIPVIALSQLNRAVETRGGSKRPMLSDLRASGQVEEHADIVGLVYRPEYYGILEDENGRSLKGVAELEIAKHRSGPVGTIVLGFEKEFARFTDPVSGMFPGAIAPREQTNSSDLPF